MSYFCRSIIEAMIVGIGSDHVEIEEFRTRVEADDERFVKRVFTDAEISYARSTDNFLQRLAGRFAAKEALLKALGTGWTDAVDWREIEIANNEAGKPVIALRGKTAAWAESANAGPVFVTISHTTHLATAYVVIESRSKT